MPDSPRGQLSAWIATYERAWRTAGTEPLRELFAPDATYRSGPFDEPLHGLDAIATFWEAERDGPGEAFAIQSGLVAVEGATGVARVEVRYGEPSHRTYRDLWIIALRPDGLCTSFEEWPFFPGQPLVSPD